MTAPEIQYDERKLKELMLYIVEKLADDPEFGSIKLNKILFYSDFIAHGVFGRPITGAQYRLIEHGPAPRSLPKVKEQLIRDGEAIEAPGTQFGHQRKRLVPLRSADLSLFTGGEIALVDRYIEQFRPEMAHTLSEYSHREAASQVSVPGEDIPYHAVFLSNRGPSIGDIARAQEIAAKHNWT